MKSISPMKLTRKTISQTCLIEVKIGERIREKGTGLEGTLRDIRIIPNGIADPTLVALIVVERDNGNKVASTIDRWEPIPDTFYLECYPSVLFDVGVNEAAQIPTRKVKNAVHKIDGPIDAVEV